MLMIAGLMSLLLVGVAVDVSSTSLGSRPEDDDDLPDRGATDPGAGGGTGEPEGSEDEVQIGTDLFDALMGYGGNDLIDGRGGADDLRGGQGDDTLLGGGGDDWIQGESDYGPGGNDLIEGGTGHDSLAGQGGDDTVHGGAGRDTIQGGDGDDSLTGGNGTDWIDGNAGNDTLVAGQGEDDLAGGTGDDLLIGNDGTETAWLHGGAGNDTLLAGAGDFVEGQEGDDLYIVRPGEGPLPVISGFDGEADEIELHLPEDMVSGSEVDLIEDHDGSLLLRVNGASVARLIGAINAEDLQILVNRTVI